MSYKAALDNLLALEFFGMKLGLRNIEELLGFLGRPERKLRAIHVAGTNGKGSVCATLAAYYQTKGLKTGLYTSPHLVDYRERIKINGEMIGEAVIESFVERSWPKVEELNATFFEVTTALAFDYFASQQVDMAIIETGLGGRLDATNVLERPLATVVTSIGMDHMQQLGNTLEAIAAEKAGIIKPGVPSIVNVDDNVLDIFRERSASVSTPFVDARTYKLPKWAQTLEPSLQGEHQKQNLRTALVVLDVLGELKEEIAAEAIPQVAKLTGLRARLEEETIEWKGRQLMRILDVGHNEAAMMEIAAYLKKLHKKLDKNVILVAGFMRDKDVRAAVGLLSDHVSTFVAVQPSTKRAMPSAELAEIGRSLGLNSIDGRGVTQGYLSALDLAAAGDIVLVAGSHYVVGELLANEKSALGVV